jgi:signal transduction histidine kinase
MEQDIKSLVLVPSIRDKKCTGFVGLDFVKDYHNTTDDEIHILTMFSQMLVNVELRKQYENELINQKNKAEESNKLKSAFLQNLSHEIRTPMNAIVGFTGFLDDPFLSEDKRKEYINIIQNSSNLLLANLSDILTISAIETKQEKVFTEIISLNEIFSNAYNIYMPKANEKNIQLILNQYFPDEASQILSDKSKITQILNHLLNNAIKFTHEGKIEFGYTPEHINSLELIKIYVKDTGIGIEKELHKKIFNRFTQASNSILKIYGGTGLGLAISKGFVEMLSGEIWVESEPQKGATFYFTIPYQSSKTNANIQKNIKLKKIKNILIAEDEEVNYIFLKMLLTKLQFNIIRANNGKEAVDICQEREDIDLILMDIKMPLMDGKTAAQIIKKIRPEIPIFAQTAYALENEIIEFKNYFDDYLTKPINKELLKLKIEKYNSV